MKTMHRVMMVAMLSVAAGPAQAALKVSNLSPEPHVVVFSSAGSVTEHPVAPNRAIYISGSDGMLSLKNAKPTAADNSIIGTRNGLFGLTDTMRSQGTPASQMDEFVIWPDGRLMFQKRQKGGRTGR